MYKKIGDLLISAILCFTFHRYDTLYIDLYEIVDFVKAVVIGTSVQLNLSTAFVVIHFLRAKRCPLNGFETQK